MKCLLIFLCILSVCSAARILGIIPMGSYSHQIPFRPIWRELSLRGHQVTVMTTDPMHDKSLTNLTEIDMSFTYDILKKLGFPDMMSDESKSFIEILRWAEKLLNELSDAQLSYPPVKKLIEDKSINFDLVIIEGQSPSLVAFAWRFNCPAIAVSSLEVSPLFHDAMGNPNHPIINPDPQLGIIDPDNLTFKERLLSFGFSFVTKTFMNFVLYPIENKRFKKFFGNDAPNLWDIQDRIQFVMTGTNPVLQGPRAVNPNTIFIGNGLHLTPPKSLPQDLQEYLDNSKQGVIYFSLGSNVKGHLLNDTTKQEILGAFAELPYNVLMKMDVELSDVPKNVKIQKWLPQQDVLRHPNIKLFISQGGLQSLQESITNGIPLVGIPFFGDQNSNVYRMVKKGYGVRIDKKEITKENLKAAIVEVIENPKYREKAKEMGELLHDEPMTSLEKAVWWIEYVIRHKGAKHLRSPAVDMPFYIYYMLDVIGFLLLVSVVALYITYKLLKLTAKKLFSKKTKEEVKKKTN